MRNLALKAQRKLRESYGAHATIHVFKNNVDSAGHAFGCHENYLVRRFVPLETIEHQLLPFLITRQLYTGAGRMTPDGFQITQRADFPGRGPSPRPPPAPARWSTRATNRTPTPTPSAGCM